MISLMYLLRVSFFCGLVAGIPFGIVYSIDFLKEMQLLGFFVCILVVPLLAALSSASYILIGYIVYKKCAFKNIFGLKFDPQRDLKAEE